MIFFLYKKDLQSKDKRRENIMAEFYDRLVLAHKRTCDENNKSVRIVPYTYRETVSQMLTDKGYDLNGNR